MSTKTIGQLEDSNQLDGNDFIPVYNAEPGSDHVTYKARINNVLALKSVSVNGKTGNTITINADDIGDNTTIKKFVSSSEKSKIGVIKTDQGASTFLAGDGNYRSVDLSYSGQTFITSATNLGGVGIFSNKSGTTFQYKGLVAGSNITLTPTSTGITISSGGVGGDFVTQSNFNSYTGTTVSTLSSKLSTSIFNTYTGTTVSALTSKLNVSSFNTFSGTTLPLVYLSKSAFNTYSGLTETRLSDLESATGSTTSASNGLTEAEGVIQLGGDLLQDTLIRGGNMYALNYGEVGGQELTAFNIQTTGGYSEWNAGSGIVSFYSVSTNPEEGSGFINVFPYGVEIFGGIANAFRVTINGTQLSANAGEVSMLGSDVPAKIGVSTGADVTTLILTPSATTPTMIVDSSVATFAGIEYAHDFSPNFSDNSIINKGYADASYMPLTGDDTALKYWKTSGTTTQTGMAVIDADGFVRSFVGGKTGFEANPSYAAINIGSNSTDPSSPSDGDLYYNNVTNKLRLRANGAWVNLN